MSERSALQTLTFSCFLAIMIGWLLWRGQAIIMPIFTAVILVYIMSASVDKLAQLPIIGQAPRWVQSLMVLAGVIIALLALGWVVADTVTQLSAVAPSYMQNLQVFATDLAQRFGYEQSPSAERIGEFINERINIPQLLGGVLASLASFTGTLILVIIYGIFLIAERADFSRKLAIAFAKGGEARKVETLIGRTNERIGSYLATKTYVNIILGVLSYIVLWIMDVDFALFWAIMIGLLNYIPYVGSLLGVMFPIILSLAQFASLPVTLILLALLVAAQNIVGYVLEPRMIGKSVNISPFVVMVALSFWGALWGVAGAILAIPMMSILAIIFSAFDATRPFAVLMSEDGHVDRV